MKELIELVKKHIISMMVGIVVFTVLVLLAGRWMNSIFVQGPEVISTFFIENGLAAILVFALIYVIANLFLTPSIPFLLVSGIAFGLVWGTIFALVCEVLSASANYYVGRYLAHKIPTSTTSEKFKLIKKYLKKHGFGLVFVLRYLGFYFDLVSYASGVSRVKYKKYLAATLLGFTPYIVIYVYAGATLLDVRSSTFVFTIFWLKLLLFAVFFLSYWGYNKHKAL